MQNFSRVSKHGQSIDVSFAKYSPVFACLHFTILRTSLLVTLSSQLIFSILLHIHISKASYLLLSVWVNVQVSAAYISTLQAKHFIILFFSSKFILLVSNIFFFINTLPSQLCSEYLLCNIHHLTLGYLNIWIGSLCSTCPHTEWLLSLSHDTGTRFLSVSYSRIQYLL